MKKNHKLTPDVDKHIKKLAETLPLMAQTINGKIMYRATSKPVKWKDIEKEKKEQYLKSSTKKAEDIKDDDTFILKGSEAVLVNHYLKMIDAFKKSGHLGVNRYVESINIATKKQEPKVIVQETPSTEEAQYGSYSNDTIDSQTDAQLRKEFPANVEGSPEFNEANESLGK